MPIMLSAQICAPEVKMFPFVGLLRTTLTAHQTVRRSGRKERQVMGRID